MLKGLKFNMIVSQPEYYSIAQLSTRRCVDPNNQSAFRQIHFDCVTFFPLTDTSYRQYTIGITLKFKNLK